MLATVVTLSFENMVVTIIISWGIYLLSAVYNFVMKAQ